MVSEKSPKHETQSSFPWANDGSTLEAPITPVHFKHLSPSLTLLSKGILYRALSKETGWKQSPDRNFYLESSSIDPRKEMANSLATGQDALYPHQNDCESSFQQHSANHYGQELHVKVATKSVLVMKRSLLFPWREIEPSYSHVHADYSLQSCWLPHQLSTLLLRCNNQNFFRLSLKIYFFRPWFSSLFFGTIQLSVSHFIFF